MVFKMKLLTSDVEEMDLYFYELMYIYPLDGRSGQGQHSRSVTTPGTLASISHTRTASEMSRSSEDPDNPNTVRNAIATLERRITHQQEPRVGGQHRYRATVNYWKEVNQANRMAVRDSSISSGHGSLDSRGPRDGAEMTFSRMANDRRSARELRPRLHETPARLQSSQEELEQISSLAAVRQSKILGSQDELNRVADDGSSHARQNSMEDKLEPYTRGRGKIDILSSLVKEK